MPYMHYRGFRDFRITTAGGEVIYIEARSSLEAGSEFIARAQGSKMVKIEERMELWNRDQRLYGRFAKPSRGRATRFLRSASHSVSPRSRYVNREPECDVIEGPVSRNRNDT